MMKRFLCHGFLPPLLAFSFERENVVEHHPLADHTGNDSAKGSNNSNQKVMGAI